MYFKNKEHFKDTPFRVRFKNTLFKDLVKYHHGFGTWIRNTYGLWKKDSELLKSIELLKKVKHIHPDEASQFIIELVWKKLNGK